MAADGYIEHKARTDRRDYQREEGANERTPPEIVQYTANYNPNLCSSAERLYPSPHASGGWRPYCKALYGLARLLR